MRTTWSLGLAAFAVACGGASAAPEPREPPAATPAPAAPEPDDSDTAVFSTDRGLVMVGVPSGRQTVHAASHAGWCAVDPRANVVWLVQGETRELSFLDLEAPGTITPVAVVPADIDEIIIDHEGAGDIGGGDPVSFRVALAISVTAEPSARAVIGCDGDGAVYCFEEDFETLLPEYEAQLQAADAVVLREPDRLAALYARARDTPVHRPAPAASTELPRVSSVPESRCDELPEDCGRAEPLADTGLWLVITSNARGDYFHQDRNLYDPRTERFVDPRTFDSTSEPPDGDVEGLFVAPSGRAFAYDGHVRTLEGELVFEAEDARVCGFVGGGVRVGGPRE